MRGNPAFKSPAQSRIVLRDFDAPTNVGDKYIQRLTSYLQVCNISYTYLAVSYQRRI